MQELLENGVLVAGPSVLSVVSRGTTRYGDLESDGTISYQGEDHVLQKFQTPSAFSLHILRLDNSTRKSSAGWNDVRYNNIPISTYRRRLAAPDTDRIEQPIENVNTHASGDLRELHSELLHKIFQDLNCGQLLQISAASKTFAVVAEEIFEGISEVHPEWKRRVSRRTKSQTRFFPWRSNVWRNSCRCCSEPGIHRITKGDARNTSLICYFCERCKKSQQGLSWLVKHKLNIPSSWL